MLGFQPRLAPELGYGKAVHHVMRASPRRRATRARVPTASSRSSRSSTRASSCRRRTSAHHQLKDAARRLVASYATKHEDDLHRVWETERPFELHLDGVTISGRADVILDKEGGVPTALAIVDYKTSTSGEPATTHCSCRSTPKPAAAKGSTSAAATSTTSREQPGTDPGRRGAHRDADPDREAPRRAIRARDYAPEPRPALRALRGPDDL